jgi:hypothetical protein
MGSFPSWLDLRAVSVIPVCWRRTAPFTLAPSTSLTAYDLQQTGEYDLT